MDRAMWRLFIFDLDGTLMDSTHAEKMCYVSTFDRFGMRYDASRLDAYINQSLEATYDEVEHGDVPFAGFASGFMTEAGRTFDSNVAPFPETEEVLKGIHAMGIPMCIATRMGGRRARALLASFGLDGYFDLIIGAEDVSRHNRIRNASSRPWNSIMSVRRMRCSWAILPRTCTPRRPEGWRAS